MKNEIDRLDHLFNPYKNKLKATQVESILMTLVPAQNLSLYQSKIGGIPYLAPHLSHPRSRKGDRLKLLAQINFAEVPENALFPKSGILQFYINGQDDLWGMNLDYPCRQDGFRVLFFEEVFEAPNELNIFEFIDDDLYDFPVNGQYKIDFTPTLQFISVMDHQLPQVLFGVDDFYDYEECFVEGDLYTDFLAVYEQYVGATGHRLGGYPHFNQSDPRKSIDLSEYILLFQLDSQVDEENHIEVIWGDMGVGSFFIHPEDLKNKDFSKVLYYWDCP